MIRNAVDPELFALPRDPEPTSRFLGWDHGLSHALSGLIGSRVMIQDLIECKLVKGRLGNVVRHHIQVTSHRSFTETLQGYRIMPPRHNQENTGHDEPDAISSR
jgi:hypothetical protein